MGNFSTDAFSHCQLHSRYSGRLDAHLPQAIRLIMVKADGCIAIHADGGAYKPLNWMNAPNNVRELEEEANSRGLSPTRRASS